MYGSTFGGGRRVLLVLPGGEAAARAVPLLGDGQAGLLGEAGPGLVPVGAPVGDVHPGAASPRSASPIGPAPTRDPRIALPPAMSTYPVSAKRARRPRPDDRPRPHQRRPPTVKRSRLRSATERAAQRAGHAAAEHVGQAATLALVQQDEQGQEQAGHDQQDLEADLYRFHEQSFVGGVGGNRSRHNRSGAPTVVRPRVRPRASGRLQVVAVAADRGELVGVDRRARRRGRRRRPPWP